MLVEPSQYLSLQTFNKKLLVNYLIKIKLLKHLDIFPLDSYKNHNKFIIFVGKIKAMTSSGVSQTLMVNEYLLHSHLMLCQQVCHQQDGYISKNICQVGTITITKM